MRLRRLNLFMLLPIVAAGGVLHVALEAQNWWHAIVLSVGVVAGVVGFVRWADGKVMTVAVPCLLIGGAVWFFGAAVADSGGSFIGLLIVGPLVVPELRRFRLTAGVALVVFVAVVGSAKLWLAPDEFRSDLIGFVIVPAALTAVVVGLRFPNHTFYDVVRDLEDSREREAELAVMRERVRFAGDLHDIQGHTLHVVKLKAALAQKILRSDPVQAEQELREIHALVVDTIGQTKALAYGERRLNLQAELENAKNLLEAAGAKVVIARDGEPDPAWSDLLSQVLRETTTNILRHAQAGQVRIELGAAGMEITNDGADHDRIPELRGLAGLRERVVDGGGTLVVEQHGQEFRTAVLFVSTEGRSPR
ncbi:histidine kinase dimerization and phosphoacceptor region [Kribbella flavida DSM 17836]|uniref:Histidine kinase dimerization and phosphoacceptor region n=1 Tax=Kribbella flavida (strain DSM 17836 / JCM 10339 / NBRC 14399) TaxID=479435 RepID=D2PYT2_KRIFD|nr:histidine kinase [Kribbella flavida]ADB29928.1 histidine kinase dimerization and phosphoacceptor region [Kribbella flavida DSM 17836]